MGLVQSREVPRESWIVEVLMSVFTTVTGKNPAAVKEGFIGDLIGKYYIVY